MPRVLKENGAPADVKEGYLVIEKPRPGPTWAFKIRGSSTAAIDPAFVGLGPINSCKHLISQAGINVKDLDLIEINEAFAAQSIQVHREMGWDLAKVNVLGGAIALGHPVGSSGTRILVTPSL